MSVAGLRVLVSGGGIGGVAAALALAQRGAEVTVFEQARELADLGAGVQISANGLAVLRALGVAEALAPIAVHSEGTRICDFARGREVAFVPVPRAGPTWYLHRADLLAALLAAARAAGVRLETGACVRSLEPGGEAHLADGQVRQGDVLIAAEGGQSATRQRLFRPSQARFTQQVAWRSLVPWQGTGAAAQATLTMGPGAHVVCYPLRQGRLLNVVAVEERTDWTEEGWRHKGDPEALRERFSGFGGEVGEILARIEQTHLWALHLHPVAQSWVSGRVVLLGDAAHPTLPFMAQGACLALEDAWVLASALEARGASARRAGLDAGLGLYQDLRRARAARVVAAAAGNARRFHLRGPARYVAQAGLGLVGGILARRLAWVYDYDATRLPQLQAARSTQIGT